MTTANISKAREIWGMAVGGGYHDNRVRAALSPAEYAGLTGGPNAANRWSVEQLLDGGIAGRRVASIANRLDAARAGVSLAVCAAATGLLAGAEAAFLPGPIALSIWLAIVTPASLVGIMSAINGAVRFTTRWARETTARAFRATPSAH